MQRSKTKGFTIVELLVVIVVIGILASITIISYIGVQDKARNAQIVSSLNQWETIIRSYEATTGSYPKGNLDYVCLGDSFTAEGPYVDNQCMKAPGWGISVDTGMMSSLKQVSQYNGANSALPSLTFINMSGESEYYRGLLYLSRNNGFGITYALKGGGNNCITGDSFFVGSGFVACRHVLFGDPYAGL